MVRYPTGDGPMHDVTLKGRTLMLSTSQVLRFESSSCCGPIQGEVTPDRIRLMAGDEREVATGVAARPAAR